jgi:hypothetical protein
MYDSTYTQHSIRAKLNRTASKFKPVLPIISFQFQLCQNCSLGLLGCYHALQKFQNTPHIKLDVSRIIQFKMHI